MRHWLPQAVHNHSQSHSPADQADLPISLKCCPLSAYSLQTVARDSTLQLSSCLWVTLLQLEESAERRLSGVSFLPLPQSTVHSPVQRANGGSELWLASFLVTSKYPSSSSTKSKKVWTSEFDPDKNGCDVFPNTTGSVAGAVSWSYRWTRMHLYDSVRHFVSPFSVNMCCMNKWIYLLKVNQRCSCSTLWDLKENVRHMAPSAHKLRN